MYLDRHIGEVIEVTLKHGDKWSKLFTQYFDPDNEILVELVATDPSGIWIKEDVNIVMVIDAEGRNLNRDELSTKHTTASFFINWTDIETILVYDDKMIFDGKKEFCRLGMNETVDDVL